MGRVGLARGVHEATFFWHLGLAWRPAVCTGGGQARWPLMIPPWSLQVLITVSRLGGGLGSCSLWVQV